MVAELGEDREAEDEGVGADAGVLRDGLLAGLDVFGGGGVGEVGPLRGAGEGDVLGDLRRVGDGGGEELLLAEEQFVGEGFGDPLLDIAGVEVGALLVGNEAFEGVVFGEVSFRRERLGDALGGGTGGAQVVDQRLELLLAEAPVLVGLALHGNAGEDLVGDVGRVAELDGEVAERHINVALQGTDECHCNYLREI